jgi:Carboxypeptidase regulatory-like domain
MSRKGLRAGIVTVVAVLLIFLGVRSWLEDRTTDPSLAHPKAVAEGGPAASQGSQQSHSVNPLPPAASEHGPDLTQQKKFLDVFRTPISFYGKVVDDKGNPIPGATARISIADRPWQDGSTYTRNTDAQGLFSITSVQGGGVYVEVSKKGYYRTPELNGRRGSYGGFKSALLGRDDQPLPPSADPALFVLRKIGEPAELIRVSARPILIPKDGTPIGVSLETGSKGAAGQDHLQVECWTLDADQDVMGRYDWRCRISVPGGGLADRTDEFAFEAPTDGYRPFDEVKMTKVDPRWKKGINKEYFARLSNGLFARFSIKLSTGGEHFFVLESYLNPKPSSRNLEADAGSVAKAGH